MAKIEKRIVCEVHPNLVIRTWHTTEPMNPIGGICNRVQYEDGRIKAGEWGGMQATPETALKAFALVGVLSQISGITNASVSHYEVSVTIADAFDWEIDGIAAKVLLAIRRYVYTIRSKVVVTHRHPSTPPPRNELAEDGFIPDSINWDDPNFEH
jgi:hypothetical protein